jgi:hypothetical protein
MWRFEGAKECITEGDVLRCPICGDRSQYPNPPYFVRGDDPLLDYGCAEADRVVIPFYCARGRHEWVLTLWQIGGRTRVDFGMVRQAKPERRNKKP